MPEPSDEPQPSYYPTRQCRLCFEECQATVELPPPGSASRHVRVRYYSADDPSLGQLITPCKCSGSARFIHEGCLDAWRKNAAQKKHFWECNICHYKYQFSRLGWAWILENPVAHFSITTIVSLILVFIFGYIADPIINLYIDPYSATSRSRLWAPVQISETGAERSWFQHFVKGLASLGVLSFARIILFANPWHWYNLRNSGIAHGTTRPGATGQERVANISWVVLVIGVLTFLYSVFRAMNSITRWFLQKAAFNIKEVPHDDDDITSTFLLPSADVPSPKGPDGGDEPQAYSTSATHLPDNTTAATQRTASAIPGAFEAA